MYYTNKRKSHNFSEVALIHPFIHTTDILAYFQYSSLTPKIDEFVTQKDIEININVLLILIDACVINSRAISQQNHHDKAGMLQQSKWDIKLVL